jgi:hypothetical protein
MREVTLAWKQANTATTEKHHIAACYPCFCRITEVDWSGTGLELQDLLAILSTMTQLITLSTQGTILYSGPLPGSLGELGSLQTLKVSGGPDTLGSLPQDWSQLQEVTEVSLHNTQLTGTLPASYSNTTAVHQFGLYNITFSDGLTGLPDDWANLPLVRVELVNVTGLSGSIPSSWSNGGLLQLTKLSVQHVPSLSATLDDWWSFIDWPGAPAQQTVVLNDNGMQGIMPAGIIDPNR